MIPILRNKEIFISSFYIIASVSGCHGSFFVNVRLIYPEIKLLTSFHLPMFLKPPKPT